jgi:glyoxylase-like metal-dependent hydrolase (beta-lactamase superfamily II)
MQPRVTAFFDEATFTVSYVVAEPAGSACAVIDPVLGFDPKSGRTSTAPVDKVIAFVRETGLKVQWVLETHVHADHLTASPQVRAALGGRTAIGDCIGTVQRTFKSLFNFGDWMATDGRQFQQLLGDGEVFRIGAMDARVMHTPGHTPACITYVIARADFPGGDAAQLYRSIRKILALPPATRLFMCHDYGPNGRNYAWETTVTEQNASNIHIKAGVSEDDFVAMRTERDRKLAVPVLLLPSVQVNMTAGTLPPPEANGVSYLKIPVNAFK